MISYKNRFTGEITTHLASPHWGWSLKYCLSTVPAEMLPLPQGLDVWELRTTVVLSLPSLPSPFILTSATCRHDGQCHENYSYFTTSDLWTSSWIKSWVIYINICNFINDNLIYDCQESKWEWQKRNYSHRGSFCQMTLLLPHRNPACFTGFSRNLTTNFISFINIYAPWPGKLTCRNLKPNQIIRNMGKDLLTKISNLIL